MTHETRPGFRPNNYYVIFYELANMLSHLCLYVASSLLYRHGELETLSFADLRGQVALEYGCDIKLQLDAQSPVNSKK